ncbi:MAG: BACON domain-containing protein [Alistipes sp.]|nr:BACON domain-containing protein [Alistipes sp.]
MSNKLFKSIFAVAMVLGAAFGFASCVPQDEPAAADPKVEVSKTALTFSNAEGSDTLDVTATAGWKTEVAVDWVTVAPATGNGNKTITVSVSANDTDAKRETVLKVHAIHPEYGNWDTKKVTIIQSANEEVAVEEVALYSDDFDGKEVTKTYGNGNQYPYIDQFPEFVNKKGEASANVTYTGSGVSVRVVGDGGSAGSHSDYKGSGVNNIFFGTAPTYFVVNNISPLSVDQKNYKITFGTEKYEQNKDNIFSGDEFALSISKDGLAWVPVSYTFAGTEPGNWNVATAEFTLTAGVEAIYIRFDCNYSSAYRIDDLKFSIGNGGQTIDLDSVEAPEPAETITIAEALAVGQGNTINGAIEGIVISNMDLNNLTSKKGMYVQDETGALQFYLGANHTFAFGTKVRIDLTGVKLAEYNGAVQVSGIGLDKITTISTGNTVEPKSVTMADFLANKYEGQYVALEGVQVAAADLAKTWVVGDAHTSINMTDVDGNKFVVFSSKYATYGTQTVAQGAGTIKGISSISNGAMQIIFAQATDYAGLTGERFTEPETPENPDPEQPNTPANGVYESDSAFVCPADDSTNCNYGHKDTKIGTETVTGFKLGTGGKAGYFKSGAVGVSGSKYLNFYAVAWKGKSATLYFRVDGGETKSQALNAHDGATGNPPYTALTAEDKDHYSILLEGLTETSTIEFSTDASFSAAENATSGRAVVFGMKLTDEPLGTETPGGGEEPETPETPETPEQPAEVVKATVSEFLAAAEDATIYELTGVITSVTNTTYGNFYLKDDTAEVLIYGLCSPTGAEKYWAESGAKVGDTITVQTVRTSYNGTAQGKNAIFVSLVPCEAPEIDPNGKFASQDIFTANIVEENKAYLQDATINGEACKVIKFGTSSVVGTLTSSAVGVSGDATLSFYGVAWTGKAGKIAISVDGTEVETLTLTSNAGAAGNPPYTITLDETADCYNVSLTGLTETSTITLSSVSGATRVILAGVTLK